MTQNLIRDYNRRMPSVFPELLNYSQISPFILRLLVALILAMLWWSNIKEGQISAKITGWIEAIAAVFFVAGLFVQPAAVLAILIAIAEMIKKGSFENSKMIIFSLAVTAVALLLLGPGILSIDMPL